MVVAGRTEIRKKFFIRFKATRKGRQPTKDWRSKDITPEGENKQKKPIGMKVFKMKKPQERALDKKRTDFFFIERSEIVRVD